MMKYAIELLQNELNNELIYHSQSSSFVNGASHGAKSNLLNQTTEAFRISLNKADERIPQLTKAIELLNNLDSNMVLKTYNLKKIRNQVISNCIDNNPTLNIDELAKKLGISERTIQRFIGKTRKIKRVKQCREGNHRPKYDTVFEYYVCSKCNIKLTPTN